MKCRIFYQRDMENLEKNNIAKIVEIVEFDILEKFVNGT